MKPLRLFQVSIASKQKKDQNYIHPVHAQPYRPLITPAGIKAGLLIEPAASPPTP